MWESIGGFVDANWINFFRTFQMSMLIFVGFFIVLTIIISNTRYGRWVYAIGSNEPGARQAGINTPRYTLLTYMFCSFSAALGALLFLGRAPYAKSDYGQMLFGGRGSLWGTFMGVILLKLINNGLTLAQLDTFWQMVVTGLIILIAVGLDIVRQSKNPDSVRKLLGAIAALMAFLALMTPAALYLRAKLSLMEHGAATALREAGQSLAAGQNARLMSPADIEQAQTVAATNVGAMLLLLGLTMLSMFAIFKTSRFKTFVLAIAFVAMILPVSFLGYQVTTPFLVLGAIALLGSAFVHTLFARARALDVNAS